MASNSLKNKKYSKDDLKNQQIRNNSQVRKDTSSGRAAGSTATSRSNRANFAGGSSPDKNSTFSLVRERSRDNRNDVQSLFSNAFNTIGINQQDTDYFSTASTAAGIGSSLYNRGVQFGDTLPGLDSALGNLQTARDAIASGNAFNDPIIAQVVSSIYGEGYDPETVKADMLAAIDQRIDLGTYASAQGRARSGDTSVRDDAGDHLAEYDRLLRLAGYDYATDAFGETLPKERQRAGRGLTPQEMTSIAVRGTTPDPASKQAIRGANTYSDLMGIHSEYTRDMLEADLSVLTSPVSPDDPAVQEAAARVNEYVGRDVWSEIQQDPWNTVADEVLAAYDDEHAFLANYFNQMQAENGMTPQEKIQLAASGYDPAAEGTQAFDDYMAYLKNAQLMTTQQEQLEKDIEEWQQETEHYRQLVNEPDFEELSQPVAPTYEGLRGYVTYDPDDPYDIGTVNPYGGVYDLVMAGDDPEKIAQAETRLSTNPTSFGFNKNGIQYMTDEERSIFYYLYNKNPENPEQAIQYLEDISWNTQRLRRDDLLAEYQTYAEQHPVKASLASVPQNIANEIMGAGNAVASLFGYTPHEFDPTFDFGVQSSTSRSTVGSMISENTPDWRLFNQNVFRMGYDAVMSAADSAANAAIFGPGASYMMGFGAFNNAYEQNLAAGKSDTQAFIDALAEGGIEVLTEHFSIGALLDDPSSALGYFLKNALTEGTEEMASVGLNMTYDQIVNGAESEINSQINHYMAMGYSPVEARRVAWTDFLNEMAVSGITGILSGSMAAGPGAITTAVNDRRTGRGIIDAESVGGLLDVAETLNLPEDVRRLVENQRRAERALSASLPAPKAAAQAGMEQAMEEAETSQDVADAAVEAVQAQAPSVSAQAAMPEQAQLPGSDSLTQAAQQPIEQQEQQQTGTEAPAVTAEAVTAEPTTETEEDQESREWMEYIESQQTQTQETAQEVEAEPVTPDANQVREAEQEAETPAAATEQIQPAETQQQENGKPPKISAAKVGRIYREVMKQLDADAQAVVVENLNRYVQNMLIENGYDGDRTNVRILADKILRLSAGRQNVSDLEMQDIENNRAARAVVSDLTARVAEEYRIRGVQAELAGMANTQAPVTGKAAQRYLKSAAEGFSQAEADVMQRNYNEGQDAVSYAQQFRTAYEYGQDGRNLENMKGSSTFRTLNEAQLSMAYELGRAARNSAQQAAPKSVGMRVGNVDTTAIRGMRLNTAQNASVNFMSRLAKTAGFNVRFVATSANAQGQYTQENGSYDKATRTITIDVNAGRLNTSSFNYAMIHTAGHELTHFIKEFGDANLYNAYQEFVLGHLSGKMSENELNRRIAQTIAANKKLGKELSREEAIDEIVADASADLLSKMTEQDMQQLAEQNPSLLKRIKSFIQRWVKGMKALLKTAVSGQQTSNDLAKQMEDVIDEQYGKWMELFKNATENARKADAEADGTVPDQAVDVEGEIQFSARGIDAEYMEAYESGDDARAQQIIRDAAIAAGYNPLKLYHGTMNFGFTKVDPQKANDGISFFATTDDRIAESYSGENTPVRKVSTKPGMNMDEVLSADGDTLLKLLRKHVDKGFNLVDASGVRKLIAESDRTLREAQEFIREFENRLEIVSNPEAKQALADIMHQVMRLVYAEKTSEIYNAKFKYQDAFVDLRFADSDASYELATAINYDVENAASQKAKYLHGNMFELDGKYISYMDALDVLTPKMFRGVYELYGRTDNLFEMDGNGANWNNLDGEVIGKYGLATTRDYAEYAKAHGYAGVHFKNIRDAGGQTAYGGVSDVYTFFNPEDIKSADPYTYDDDGNLIPPSQRFDRSSDDIRYSVRNVDGSNVVWIDSDITKLKPPTQKYTDFIANYLTDHIGEVYTIIESGQKVYLGDDLPGEYSESKYSRRLRNKKQDLFYAKNRAVTGLGEAIEIATNRRWEKTEHPDNKDAPYGLYKYSSKIAFPVKDYSNRITNVRAYNVELLIRNASNGKKYLYDVIGIKNDAISAGSLLKRETARQAMNAVKPQGIISGVSIPQSDDSVKNDSLNQVRDPSQITDREILANAMDTMAETQAELDWVQRYRKNIGELNEKQRQMDEINADIVRMSNEDPKGNRDEIIRQQNRAKILASQIDRYDKRLLEFEAGKPLKAVVQRERTKLKDKAKADLRKYAETTREASKQREAEQREKYQAILSDVRSKRDDALSKLRKEKNAKIEELRSEKNAKLAELQREKTEAVKKVREEKNESFSRQKYLDRVQKDSATLREWLTHPTNKAHVPEFLRKPLGEFMESLDFSSKRSLSGGTQTQADQRMLNAMRDLHEALSKSHGMSAAEFGGYVDLTGNFLEQFTELRNDIERAMQGETAKLQELRDRLAVTKDPAKRAELEARIKGYETSLGTPVNLMTSQQLRALSEMITTLNTSIRKMNTALGSARQLTISGMSKNTIDNVDKLGQRKEQFEGIGAVGDFWNWNNTTPIYVFKRFGAGGQAIFEELQDGWDKLAMLADKVVKFTEDTYKSEEVAAWNKQIHEFNLNGQTVRMTATQLMSLYCLNRRDQGRQHLLGGGIRVAEMKSKGKTVSDAADHMLNEAVLDEMLSKLTQRQIEVADALQAYMSNECAKLGNEISMKRFGYEMFTESMYFPIEVDKNNLRRINEEQTMEQSIFRLLNLSSTKPLQQGANNALVLRDIFDVFASHTSDMAKYNALALPVLDMIKWYNYVEKLNSNGEPYNPEKDSGQAYQTRSVQKSLEGAFGKVARRYVETFLKDLNGDTEGGREDGMFNRLISRYKVASVAANLRVGMLQITSLPRAAYVINPKYLFSGIAKWNTSRGKISKTARDRVGIAKWKSLGFYDTSISRNMRELIKHDESTIDKVRQGSMKLAELGDSWTMGVLYGAVEAEMRDKHKELKPGSEEYNRQVNARMREIVYQSQVVDSTMTRSQFMRSKGFATLATAFMSEPTLAMNMMNDSIFEARMKSRAGENWSPLIYTKVSRALGVWMVTSAISAAVEALFSAMRDDDEFESFWEKYSDALLGDYDDAESFGDRWTAFWAGSFGGNLNPFDDIPILKDFISAYKGETSAPMWAAAFGELGDGVNRLITVIRDGGSPAEIYGAIYKLVGGMSKSTGIAASNAMRDIVSVYNTFLADRMGWRRVQTYDDSEGKAADAMIEAMIAGDEEAIEKAYERAGIYDMDPDKIADALAKRIDEAYVSGRIDRSTADRLLTEHGGKRARDAEDMLTEADYERATGHEHGKMKSDYLSGLLTEEEVREYLTEYDGMREGEIEERLGEWNYERDTGYVYSQMKADYIDGELTEEQVMEYRMEYGGAEEGDVTTLLGKWNYERDTGLAWSDMRLDYADGVISESELRTYLSKYGGKDEEQIEETVSNYDYQIATGRTTTAPKYWRIAYAYESGGDYEAYIDEAFNQIMYGGDKRKTWKQARSSIASSVASYYKKTYLAVAGTPEGDRMLERILDVYEAIGYNRSEQRRYIAENWFEA